MRRSRGFFLVECFVTALVAGGLVLLLLMVYARSYHYLIRADKLNTAYNLAARAQAGKSCQRQDWSVKIQEGDFREVQVAEKGQVLLNFYTTP